MKLICEITEEIKVIKEGADNAQKNYFIEGVFMQAELKNRNGRMYPQEMLDREISRYVTEYVDKKRAFGELGHPEGPTVNLDKVSHLIKDLTFSGNVCEGKAKILTNTPMGKIASSLIEEGAKLGVSSRGMGSLREFQGVNHVQEDFMLAAVDIVADPSAPGAFVNGIMEGKEWVWNDGILQDKTISSYKKTIKNASSRQLEEAKLEVFKDFISKL